MSTIKKREIGDKLIVKLYGKYFGGLEYEVKIEQITVEGRYYCRMCSGLSVYVNENDITVTN